MRFRDLLTYLFTTVQYPPTADEVYLRELLIDRTRFTFPLFKNYRYVYIPHPDPNYDCEDSFQFLAEMTRLVLHPSKIFEGLIYDPDPFRDLYVWPYPPKSKLGYLCVMIAECDMWVRE